MPTDSDVAESLHASTPEPDQPQTGRVDCSPIIKAMHSNYLAQYSAAAIPTYLAYTLATRGRSALSISGQTMAIGAFICIPPYVAAFLEGAIRLLNTDAQGSQELLADLESDNDRKTMHRYFNCGSLLGAFGSIAILRRPTAPLITVPKDLQHVLKLTWLDKIANTMHGLMDRAFEMCGMIIIGGGSGVLVYHLKRTGKRMGLRVQAGDRERQASGASERDIQPEKVQGLDKPRSDSWIAEYASIQLHTALRAASTTTLLAIPSAAFFWLFLPSSPATLSIVLLDLYPKLACFWGGTGLLSVLPATHSLMLDEVKDASTRRSLRNWRDHPGLRPWDRYIVGGAVLGGTILPPLIIRRAPKSFLQDFTRNGKFAYSIRNVAKLGGTSVMFGAGLGSLAFLVKVFA